MLSMQRQYDEKRNFIRMKIDTGITFTKIDGRERYEARCRNLSGTGMLLETEKKLTLGDRLRVTVPSEGPNFLPLDAIVEVVRVDALPSMHKFMIGVVIRQIDS